MSGEPRFVPQFSLRSLLALVAIVSFVFALVVPAIQRAREQARSVQCSNNLKQLGMAVQNVHDIRQELPPAYLTADISLAAQPQGLITWPVLLFAYVQQINFLIESEGRPENPYAAPGRTLQIVFYESTDEGHHPPREMSRDPISDFCYGTLFNCPSRGAGKTRDGTGQRGDYACVGRADLIAGVIPGEPRTWDGALLPCRAFNATRTNATVNGNELRPGDFRSCTNLASIIDGAANTILLGEKGVRRGHLGGHDSDMNVTVSAGEQDGTLFYGLGPHNPASLTAPGVIAFWSRRAEPASANEPALADANADPANRFGSWHSAGTQFVMVDGSVRMVNFHVAPRVLQQLASRADGAKLPPVQITLAR